MTISSPSSKHVPKLKNIQKKPYNLHNESVNGIQSKKRPNSNQDIDLSDYVLTADDQPHLLFTTTELDNKLSMICYASPNQLKCLSQCKRWQMDGTFKSATLLFYQLYIIYGWFNGEMFPLVYCFLSEKSADIYNKLFHHLKEFSKCELNPEIVMSDFEAGLISAITTSFPAAKHWGCHFHFTQCLIKHIK